MARSRSYQKTRHYDYESNKRPVPQLGQALATFEDADDDCADEFDPAFPELSRPLRFWLSPRTPLDLHRDQRGIRHLLATDIEYWHYNSSPEPYYAYA